MNRLEKTCLAGLIALPVGIGAIALSYLSTPPAFSCDYIEAQTAVSIRLHCAQRRAERQTSDSLAAAIALLKDVPIDDPYRAQSDQLIQRWTSELLAQAEIEIQAGKLDKAVSIVRSLPEDAKVRSWQTLWEKGETLMKTALSQMEKREWQQAFQTANQLRQFENQYWATEQYQTLVQQIQSDREFRDHALRDPIEPERKRQKIEFSPPKSAKLAQSARPAWRVQDDAQIAPSHPLEIARPVNQVERPKTEPEPDPQIQQPAEVEPEPPLETVQPVEPEQPEIPVPEVQNRP